MKGILKGHKNKETKQVITYVIPIDKISYQIKKHRIIRVITLKACERTCNNKIAYKIKCLVFLYIIKLNVHQLINLQ